MARDPSIRFTRLADGKIAVETLGTVTAGTVIVSGQQFAEAAAALAKGVKPTKKRASDIKRLMEGK